MKTSRISVIALLIALLFSACEKPGTQSADDSPIGPTESEKLTIFLDSIFDAAVDRNPQWQSRLGIRTDYDKWSDYSDENDDRELQIIQNELAEMKEQIDFEKLDAKSKVSYRLFEEKANWMDRGAAYRLYSYPVNQMHGVQAEIPSFLINVHRIDSIADAQDYIARLQGIEPLLDQIIKKLDDRATAGIIPPKVRLPACDQRLQEHTGRLSFRRGQRVFCALSGLCR